MIYRLFRKWWHRSPRRMSSVARHPFSAPEICEPRHLLSSVPAIASPLPAASSTTSQYDLGMVGFDEATGVWKANRFNGTEFVTETIADWKTTEGDRPTVFGDIWGTGQKDVIRYDSTTGKLVADWQAGESVSTGLISGWVPGMDLAYFTARDLNGDGRADFIGFDRVTGKWAVSTSTLNNRYDARFVGTWDKSVFWKSVSVADLDGDGREDILGFNPTAGTWHILFGTTSGSYTKYSPANPNSSRKIAQTVIANFDGTPGAEILERDAATGEWIRTSFAGRVMQTGVVGQWRTNATWVDVAVGDFWGTGRQAIIGRDDVTDEWWATWSIGNGVSTRKLTTWGLGDYVDTKFADLDGDGRIDILSRDFASGRWYVMSATSTGSVKTKYLATSQPGQTYDDVRLADLSGDGRPDLLAHRSNSSTWDILLSQPAGGYSHSEFYLATPVFRPVNPATGDFDGDGRIDLLTRDSGTDNWLKVSFNGLVLTSEHWNRWNAYSDHWSAATALDFDGDGDNDLIARDPTTGDWWLTDYEGTRSTTSRIANWNPATEWIYLQTVDFDGNGSQDLVGWDKTTGDWMWLRSENGNIVSSVIGAWDPANSWADVMIADMFGTGRPLIVGRNVSTGYWWGTWKTEDGYSTRYMTGFNPLRSYANTMLVDFEGTGKQTIVTFDLGSGRWYSIQFTANTFKQSLMTTWDVPTEWQNIFVADVDGDGKESLFGRNRTSGALVEVSRTGEGYSQKTVWTILPRETLDFAVVADTAGTGEDRLFFRSAVTKIWFQFGSESNGQFVFSAIGGWEATSGWNKVSVADLNHDDREDLVGHNSDGTWTWVTNIDNHWDSGTTPIWTPGVGTSKVQIADVPGSSDQSLRGAIIQATPGLREALTENRTLEAAALIRNWVANNVDYALFNELLDRDAPKLADNFFVTFGDNLAGASCGGYGHLMAATLNLFGIDSLIVSFGQFEAGLTHTTTVVPIRNGNTFDFYLVDATFNMTLVSPDDSSLLSYFEIIDSVLNEDPLEISVEQGSLANRQFLSTSDRNGSAGLELTGITPSGVYIHRWEDYGLDDYLNSIDPTLAAYDYAPGFDGFLQLMAQVLDVSGVSGSGPTNAEALAIFQAELTERGILQS